MPIEPQPAGLGQTLPPAEASDTLEIRWYHKAGALIYVFLCFELGVFLLLFPWLDLWQQNLFSNLSPAWYEVWISPYFRGAISGLGLLDLCISFSELFRLRRFARPE